MSQPLGWLPVVDSLPFSLIHGESLIAVAALALEEAGVELLDDRVDWATTQRTGRTVVIHDPRCPLTPPRFIAEAIALAEVSDAVVVGWQPVTDTIKTAAGRTVDRQSLRRITSPVVLPARVVAQLAGPADPLTLVPQLGEVTWLQAPAEAARVSTTADLAVLAAATRRSS